MRANHIKENDRKREEFKPEFATQLRERNRGKADGGVHAIDRAPHKSRKQEVGEAKTIATPPKRRYMRASMLPGVPAIPGYYCEYVRRDNRRHGDHQNMIAHLRSGWELARTSDFETGHLPTYQIAGHGEVIGNDDTVLMKIDEELWSQRNAEIEDSRDAATRAINNPRPQLEVGHPSMPLTDVTNRSTSKLQDVAVRKRGVTVQED